LIYTVFSFKYTPCYLIIALSNVDWFSQF